MVKIGRADSEKKFKNYTISNTYIDYFNVIVFIQATDHVITMLCHVTKNIGWQKYFQFHRYHLIQAKFYLDNKFLLVNISS